MMIYHVLGPNKQQSRTAETEYTLDPALLPCEVCLIWSHAINHFLFVSGCWQVDKLHHLCRLCLCLSFPESCHHPFLHSLPDKMVQSTFCMCFAYVCLSQSQDITLCTESHSRPDHACTSLVYRGSCGAPARGYGFLPLLHLKP